MSEIGRSFGPMHGERTRRHQMVVADGSGRSSDSEIIVTVYELHTKQPRQAVELTHGLGVGVYARADLSVEQAAALRDWLDEFVRAWGQA